MIEKNKNSVSYKNNGKANIKSKAQESSFEEFMAYFVKKPLFGFLKGAKEPGVKLVRYPVSDYKKKEPDFIYLDKKDGISAVIEVKSSLSSVKKVNEIIKKYEKTSYGGKKPDKIIIVSNSKVPPRVMKEIGKRHLDRKKTKVYVITPRMMQAPLEEELKVYGSLPKKRKYLIEGYKKALLLAEEIAEVNRANTSNFPKIPQNKKKVRENVTKKKRGKINKNKPNKPWLRGRGIRGW